MFRKVLPFGACFNFSRSRHWLTELYSKRHQLSDGSSSKLLHNAMTVRLHRALCSTELVGDLLVETAKNYQSKDLILPRGKRAKSRAQRIDQRYMFLSFVIVFECAIYSSKQNVFGNRLCQKIFRASLDSAYAG